MCHIVIFFIYSFKCHCVCGFAEISPAWQIVEIAWTKATDCLKFQINIVSVAGNSVADVMIKRKFTIFLFRKGVPHVSCEIIIIKKSYVTF